MLVQTPASMRMQLVVALMGRSLLACSGVHGQRWGWLRAVRQASGWPAWRLALASAEYSLLKASRRWMLPWTPVVPLLLQSCRLSGAACLVAEPKFPHFSARSRLEALMRTTQHVRWKTLLRALVVYRSRLCFNS